MKLLIEAFCNEPGRQSSEGKANSEMAVKVINQFKPAKDTKWTKSSPQKGYKTDYWHLSHQATSNAVGKLHYCLLEELK